MCRNKGTRLLGERCDEESGEEAERRRRERVEI
jgi:hypothetical protein